MQEAVEFAGDVPGLEVEVEVLLGELVLGQRDDFIGCHAGDRDQEGAVDLSGIHFAVEFIKAVSCESSGAGAY